MGSSGPANLTISTSPSGDFSLGQSGATYSIQVINTGGTATSGTVSVNDVVPTGLTATAISGTNWACTQPAGPCTRSDTLAPGNSYPLLTVTVNVASNAPSSVTNRATVSGGGMSGTNSASDPTNIDAGPPVSDDFPGTTLNTSIWTVVNPLNDGGS